MSDRAAATSAVSSATTPAPAAGPLIVATGITKSFFDVDREIRVLVDLSLTESNT